MIKKEDIIDAYLFLRKNNHSIPSETLDFIKAVSIRELEKIEIRRVAKLEEIWIENHANSNPAIRIDWDNGRHHRVEIKGRNPLHVIEALKLAELELKAELHNGNITI